MRCARSYNRRYKYLLIDEYQDTNRPQYELMKLLTASHHNVCVVGDEDQSDLQRGAAQTSRTSSSSKKIFLKYANHPPRTELPLH